MVRMGFQVNDSEFNQMKSAIGDMSKEVQKHTEGMSKAFVSASTVIATSLAGVAIATAGLIDEVAQLDLGYQKLALRMYTTADMAKQFKIVTSAMGENINDIAWIPELSQRYTQLMEQSKQMETPTDSEDGLKKVRDIRFEFTRMKVEVMYAMQWIGYYIIKYLSGPLDTIENKLKSCNDWITRNMPTWTAKVAEWIVMFIDFGKSIVRFTVDVIEALEGIWKAMSGSRKFIALIASLVLAFSPFKLAIGAVLLLIDDFYAYIDGRKSSKTLAPIWQQLLEWFREIKPYLIEFNKWVNDFADNVLKACISELKGLWEILKTIFSEVGKSISKNGVWSSFRDTTAKIGDMLNTLAKGLMQVGKDMGILSQDTRFVGFWSSVGDAISGVLKIALGYVNVLATVGKMVGQLLQHDWLGAWQTAKSIPKNFIGDMVDAVNGGRNGASQKGGRSIAGLDDFAERLALYGEKSGGDYDSPGHMDEGHWNLGGKYQILAENWPSWAKSAGLDRNAPYTKENQEIVAKNQMSRLYSDYGDWSLVAAAWNGGYKGAESYKNYGKDSYENQYVSDVMRGAPDSYYANQLMSSTDSLTSGNNYSQPQTNTQQTPNIIYIDVPAGAQPGRYAVDTTTQTARMINGLSGVHA